MDFPASLSGVSVFPTKITPEDIFHSLFFRKVSLDSHAADLEPIRVQEVVWIHDGDSLEMD